MMVTSKRAGEDVSVIAVMAASMISAVVLAEVG